jgi:hypothetical protein
VRFAIPRDAEHARVAQTTATTVSSLATVRRRSRLRRTEYACAAMLRLALILLIVLTFGAITPLAHVTPPDQTWIGGLYDNADHDDVILAVIGLDGSRQWWTGLLPVDCALSASLFAPSG